jgi:hypothetical protein
MNRKFPRKNAKFIVFKQKKSVNCRNNPIKHKLNWQPVLAHCKNVSKSGKGKVQTTKNSTTRD